MRRVKKTARKFLSTSLYKTGLLLCFVFISTLSLNAQNRSIDADTSAAAKARRDFVIDSIRGGIADFIDEFTDIQMFDKSLETRKLGKNNHLVDSIENTYNKLGIDFMTIASLDVDEFWARTWTSKKAYSPTGKIDTNNLADKLGRYVVFRIKIDSTTSMKNFEITSNVTFGEQFNRLLNNANKLGLEAEINEYLTEELNTQKATSPNEYKQPVLEAIIWINAFFREELPKDVKEELLELKKSDENVEEIFREANENLYVQFIASNNQQFGFDAYNPEMYQGKWEENYEIATMGDSKKYYIAYKSVEKNQSNRDLVIAKLVNKNKDSLDIRNITFQDKDGAAVTGKLINLNRNEITLELKDIGADSFLYAYWGDKKLGKLIIKPYKRTVQEVLIVPLGTNLSLTKAELANQIGDVFTQAAVDWTVTLAPSFTPEEESLKVDNYFPLPTGEDLAQYTPEMRNLRKAYLDKHPITGKKPYLLFIVNGFSTLENPNISSTITGFMPRGRGMGFIKRSAVTDGHTLPHELGHGAFGLEHTWHDGGPEEGATQNLMDYNEEGTHLTYSQWKEIHNPLPTISYRDDTEDAANSLAIHRTFIDPAGRLFNVTREQFKLVSVIKDGPIIAFEKDAKVYRAKIENDKFLGYADVNDEAQFFEQELNDGVAFLTIVKEIASNGEAQIELINLETYKKEGKSTPVAACFVTTPESVTGKIIALAPKLEYLDDGTDVVITDLGYESAAIQDLHLSSLLLDEKCDVVEGVTDAMFFTEGETEEEKGAPETENITFVNKQVTRYSAKGYKTKYELEGAEEQIKQKYQTALSNDYDLSAFTIIENGNKITRSNDGKTLAIAPITPKEIEAIKTRLRNGETNGESEALFIAQNKDGKTEVYVGYKKFTRSGWDDSKRVALQEEQQTKVETYLEQKKARLETQRAEEQSGTFVTDGSKTVIKKGSYLETISGLLKQTGELLNKASIPESVYDDQSSTYPKAIFHTSPYGCGLGNGAIEQVRGTADGVVAIGSLITDVALNEEARSELVDKFSKLNFADVKNFAVKSATEFVDNVTDTSDKGWHSKGKATVQVASIFISFTGGFKAMDKFGDIVKKFDDLAARSSKSFIGPRKSLRDKFDNLTDLRKAELVDEDALDGFVNKLVDLDDVAKKNELLDVLNKPDVSAEEFSIFGKLANADPKFLTKEYFEEIRGVLKHPEGEKLVDSWKTLEKAGVDKAIRNRPKELQYTSDYQRDYSFRSIKEEIDADGGYYNWKNRINNLKPLGPEPQYLRNKTHGVNGVKSKAVERAIEKNLPQGKWGNKADLDYAGKKAANLKPEDGIVDFPINSDHKSIVYYKDGKTSIPDKIRVRNNGNGQFHGFPIDSKTAEPIHK